jgi:hypothetical protein
VLVERRADGKIVLRVTDFGIGAIAAQPVLERSRATGSLEGSLSSVLTGAYSPLYASPQQMRGDKADPRDDVYALGVIWYQLLQGDLSSPAPAGRRWMEVLRGRGMSDVAIELLSSCFESDPAYRPADAGMLVEQLLALAPAGAKKPAEPITEFWLVDDAPPGVPEAPAPPPEAKPKPARPVQPARSTGSSSIAPGPNARGKRDKGSNRWAVVAAGLLGALVCLGVILYTYIPPPAPPPDPDRTKSAPTKPDGPSPARAAERSSVASVPTDNAAAASLPEYVTTGACRIKLRLIPAGEFMMGSDATDPDAYDDEFVDKAAGRKEKHRVRITQPFYLGVTEVTRGQFREFVDEAGYKTDAEQDGKGGYGWNEQKGAFEQDPKFTWQNAGFDQSDDNLWST